MQLQFNHPTSLRSMLSSIVNHRSLIHDLARRDVRGRYQGSFAGLAWSFVTPILMLLVYTFVFGVIFQSRWGTSNDGNRAQFALILFVGLMIFSAFADCVNRSTSVIRVNANYVKKVVFPLNVLPVVFVVSAGFNLLISIFVFLIASLLINGHVPWQSIFIPIILLPLALGTLGITWALASLGLYVQDIGQAVSILTTMLMFLSPIFFPLNAVPEQFRSIVAANPLSFYIEQSRAALIWGLQPDWQVLAVHLLAASLVAWSGYWWFQKTRKGFSDVL